MISTPNITATLPPKIRKDIGIQALSRSMPIARIARENQVSRKFAYEQEGIDRKAPRHHLSRRAFLSTDHQNLAVPTNAGFGVDALIEVSLSYCVIIGLVD